MVWMRRAALIGLVLALPAQAATRALTPDDLPEIADGTVQSVEDGTSLTLNDGRVLRLAGLLAPAAPLAMAKDAHWPAADAARQALADLVLGRTISLHATQSAPDRHGRLVGQVILADGSWVERSLLKQGQDRLEPTRELSPLAAPLLKAEADARRHRRGLWRLPIYAVRSPDNLTARDTGSFVLVEGKVLSVAPSHDATYLDFAEDWHHGFTVRLPRALLQRVPDFDPAAFEGKSIRVRGWLVYEGRPILDLEDATALEPLTKPRKAPKRR